MAVEGIIKGKKHKELRKVLDKICDRVKQSDTYKDVCKEYEVDEDMIDCVPMCFAKLNVSARTESGIIYFNVDLLKKVDDIEHYMIHEFTHVLQQCLGNKPTKTPDKEHYLEDKNEKESFHNQCEYIEETDGSLAANEYVDKLLDFHEVENDEDRNDTKKELMACLQYINKTAELFHPPEDLTESLTAWAQKQTVSYILNEALERLDSGSINNITRFNLEQLSDECYKYTENASSDRSLSVTFLLSNVLNWKLLDQHIGPEKKFETSEDILDELIRKNWPNEIPIHINFDPSPEEKNLAGWWDSEGFHGKTTHRDDTKSVNINVDVDKIFTSKNDMVDTFKRTVFIIQQSVRHELQHMSQEIVKDITGSKELGGLPPKKIRNPRDYSFHENIDYEFYTNLHDNIDDFNNQISQLPSQVSDLFYQWWIGDDSKYESLLHELYFSLNDLERKEIDEQPDAENSWVTFMLKKYYPFLRRDKFLFKLRILNYNKWDYAVKKLKEAI